MGNTQSVWVLCGALLILNFLNTNGQKTKAVESHWIVETAKLNQLIYFIHVLTVNGSQKICYAGGEVLLLFPQETKSCIFVQN